MFRNAPIQKLLREAIGLLRLIKGNGPVVALLHGILTECLERIQAAVARDSEYWEEIRAGTARDSGKGERG